VTLLRVIAVILLVVTGGGMIPVYLALMLLGVEQTGNIPA